MPDVLRTPLGPLFNLQTGGAYNRDTELQRRQHARDTRLWWVRTDLIDTQEPTHRGAWQIVTTISDIDGTTRRGFIATAHDYRSVLTRAAMTIDLTANEVRVLRDLLETQISDLGAEIHHPRTPDYHQALKTLRESFKTLDRELSEASS
jgi:hypothetical protein